MATFRWTTSTGTLPHITGTLDHITGMSGADPVDNKTNEANEMMLFHHADTFFLTEMVHVPHHVLKPALDSPTLDHFHRNRWTNSPE